MGHRVGILVAVALACFAAGASLPWLAPPATVTGFAVGSADAPRHTPIPTRGAIDPTAAGPAAPSQPRAASVLAIGDSPLHDETDCLAQSGIRVHPRIIRSVDELLSVVAATTPAYSAVLVRVSTLDPLVDGHIARVLDASAPGTRVIWSTIRTPEPGWGEFSPEDRTNASIRNVVRRHADARVLDWRAITDRHPYWQSGIGLSGTGCVEFTARVIRLAGLDREA